jgi:hypothetical protein
MDGVPYNLENPSDRTAKASEQPIDNLLIHRASSLSHFV